MYEFLEVDVVCRGLVLVVDRVEVVVLTGREERVETAVLVDVERVPPVVVVLSVTEVLVVVPPERLYSAATDVLSERVADPVVVFEGRRVADPVEFDKRVDVPPDWRVPFPLDGLVVPELFPFGFLPV